MSIVTLGKDQFPKARVVLLKQFSLEGFVFYTNYMSEKGQAILAYPQVGVSFYWPALERQVIVKGVAEKVAPGVSDAYFSSRPLGSQLGAMASMQSEVIASREVLEAKLVALHEQYKDEPLNVQPIGVVFSAASMKSSFGKVVQTVCTTACILRFKRMIGWGNACHLSKRGLP